MPVTLWPERLSLTLMQKIAEPHEVTPPECGVVMCDGGRHQRVEPFGFVPILDLIHAVTYVNAATTAGRPLLEGWPIYQRWTTWAWRGEIPQVIAELAARQAELGLPVETDGDTSPRCIVSDALTDPAEPTVPHELSGIPLPRHAADEQPHGVHHQRTLPASQ